MAAGGRADDSQGRRQAGQMPAQPDRTDASQCQTTAREDSAGASQCRCQLRRIGQMPASANASQSKQ